jgi:hypothetical protein
MPDADVRCQVLREVLGSWGLGSEESRFRFGVLVLGLVSAFGFWLLAAACCLASSMMTWT